MQVFSTQTFTADRDGSVQVAGRFPGWVRDDGSIAVDRVPHRLPRPIGVKCPTNRWPSQEHRIRCARVEVGGGIDAVCQPQGVGRRRRDGMRRFANCGLDGPTPGHRGYPKFRGTRVIPP